MALDSITALANTGIFSVLDQDNLETLGASMRLIRLDAGQTAIRQGASGRSMYIVQAGDLSVVIEDGDRRVDVGRLGPGDFFGEMSLLTGTPRTATVTTQTPVEIFEIPKSLLAPMMKRHPELAAKIGKVLSTRRSSNLKTLMDAASPSSEIDDDTLAAQLSWRIGRFFDLPSGIWGKAVAGISGFSIGGPLGFLLGKRDETDTSGANNGDRQVAFTVAIISIVAKMSAAAGSYSQREVTLLQEIYDIPPADMANVIRIHNRAQGTPNGFEVYASQIATLFRDRESVLEELLITLFRIAGSQGHVQEEALGVIARVNSIFGFSDDDFQRLKTIGGTHVADSENEHSETCLAVLDLPAGASLADAKMAYHALVMKNHPDRLVSEGMPEEFIQQANEKLAKINVAYEQFQNLHGGA